MDTVTVSEGTPITHPDIPGVVIYALSDLDDPIQEVVVYVPPNGEVPLHVHDYCEAIMTILSGWSILMAPGSPFDGIRVERGKILKFPQGKPHGFLAGPEGVEFASRNRSTSDSRKVGIVQTDSTWDIRVAAA